MNTQNGIFKLATLGMALFVAMTSLGCQGGLDDGDDVGGEDDVEETESAGQELTAQQFYNRWKVQRSKGDTGANAYTDITLGNEGSFSNQYSHDAGYTNLLLTVRNVDEDKSSEQRKPRVELRELDGSGDSASWSQKGSHRLESTIKVIEDGLNGKKRDIIVLQSHTDGNYDSYSGDDTDEMASGIYETPRATSPGGQESQSVSRMSSFFVTRLAS